MRVFPEDWTTSRKAAVIGFVLLVVVYGLSQSGDGDAETNRPGRLVTPPTRTTLPTSTPATYRVEYIVESSTIQSIDIRYDNATEGFERIEAYRLGPGAGWRMTFEAERGTHAYVTADNPRDARGDVSISCELLVNGARVDYTQAAGPSASITCNGLVGR